MSQNNAFHNTLASLPIAGAEYRKRSRLKVDVGVRLVLESRQRVEEEHAWLEAEMKARLVEEARLKGAGSLRTDEEARLSKEAMQKAEEHKRAGLKL